MHLGCGGWLNTHGMPSQGFGEGSGGMPEGNSEKQGVWSIYLTGAAGSSDTHGSRAAHRIVDQAERDGIADLQRVESRDVLQVGTVEEHVASAADADEPIHLSDEELRDPPGRECAPGVVRPFELMRTMPQF
jgi:hypothetical protein